MNKCVDNCFWMDGWIKAFSIEKVYLDGWRYGLLDEEMNGCLDKWMNLRITVLYNKDGWIEC